MENLINRARALGYAASVFTSKNNSRYCIASSKDSSRYMLILPVYEGTHCYEVHIFDDSGHKYYAVGLKGRSG